MCVVSLNQEFKLKYKNKQAGPSRYSCERGSIADRQPVRQRSWLREGC